MPRYCYFLSFTLAAGGYGFLPANLHYFLRDYLSLTVLGTGLAIVFGERIGLLRPYKRPLFLLLWLFCLGALTSQYQIEQRVSRQLPFLYEAKELQVKARIIGLASSNERSTVFDAWVDEARLADSSALIALKGKVRLSWYKRSQEQLKLKVGDSHIFTVRLRRPRSFVNPGGFDYQAWQLARSYVASGYIREHLNQDTHLASASFTVFINRLREKIQSRMGFENYTHGAVLQALLIGEKSGIDQQDWWLLQYNGCIHLMAISGLHIGLVAGFAFLLGRIVGLVLPGAYGTLILPALCSLGAASLYAALAGFSIPTQRALILVLLLNVSRVLGKRVNPLDLLSLSALVIVCLDPFAFYSAGFWLSYLAVAVLIYCFSHQQVSASKWRSLLSAQAVMFLGLAMPLAVLGLPTSLAAPLANLVAVPLVSVFVVPSLFLAAFTSFLFEPISQLFLSISDYFTAFLWVFFRFMRDLDMPLLWLSQGQNSFYSIVSGGLGAVLLLAPKGLAFRGLGAALLVLSLSPTAKKQAGLNLTVLDVGQGLAVVIQHQDFSMVYDTGDRFSANFDIGSRVLLPYLRHRAVPALDLLVLSHGDRDHAGGMDALVEALEIDEIVAGPDIPLAENLQMKHCSSGQRWQHGELFIEVLHPDPAHASVPSLGANNLSCTLLVSFRGFALMLPGDIEAFAEHHLISSGRLPKVDILLAPHHGSQSSSSSGFIQALQPSLAVVSAGYLNRYRHPSKKVLKRYHSYGVEVVNTALDGAITIQVNSKGEWQMQKERRVQNRIWHSDP